MTHNLFDYLPSNFGYANPQQAEEYAQTGAVTGASRVIFVVDQDALQVETDFLMLAGDKAHSRVFYENEARERIRALAIRLRPPCSLDEIKSTLGKRVALEEYAGSGHQALAWYIQEYSRGWSAGKRGSGKEFATGYTNHAYDDGYLDATAGRIKWHLTYCTDHDNCGEG